MADTPQNRRVIAVEITGPGGTAWRFHVPVFWAWVLGLLFLAFVASAALAAVHYARAMNSVHRYAALAEEVDSLQVENRRLRKLEEELRRLRELQEQMLHLAGIRAALGDEAVWTEDLPGTDSEERTDSVGKSERIGRGGGEDSDLAELQWPLSGRVGREFTQGHPGVDIEAAPKQLVLAAGDGVVVEAGKDPRMGNRIVIQHPGGLRTVYANNAMNLVTVGEVVEQGKVIAVVGSSPESKTPHLHFEVWKNGKAVSPKKILRAFPTEP